MSCIIENISLIGGIETSIERIGGMRCSFGIVCTRNEHDVPEYPVYAFDDGSLMLFDDEKEINAY